MLVHADGVLHGGFEQLVVRVSVHKHADSPELRQTLKGMFKNGTPPA